MTTIQTFSDGEQLSQVRGKINGNFANLNADKMENTGKSDGTETTFGDGINQVKIGADGSIRLEGTATEWEDENFDPTMLTGGGALPSSISFASTGLKIAGFGASGTDGVEGCREYPHKAKLNVGSGTSVVMSFHAHCYPTTTNIGNVRLALTYFFTKEGVAVTTSTTIYKTFTTSGTAWAKSSYAFDDIPVPNELGSQFHFGFSRLGADVLDTYPDDIAISTIGFHYEIDSLGSKETLVK